MKILAFLILALWTSPILAIQSVVILPFVNESKDQHVFWLGEAFAESLSEELLLKDGYVLQRAMRLNAYEELKLPYTGDLSRATMLKIGEQLSADYIVFGSFNVTSSQLEAEAKIVKLSTSELSEAIRARGTVENLYEVQMVLRDGLLKYFVSRNLQALEAMPFETKSVPLRAYELYIKGLLEPPGNERIDLFRQALQANPGYLQASYRLGLTLSKLQRYRESNNVLASVPFTGLMNSSIQFLIGLNLYYSNDYRGAYEKWMELSKTAPTPEVMSNIGVALLKQDDLQGSGWYLSKAAEQNPDQPHFRFNLAASYVLRKYGKNALQQFREVIRLNPADYQAFYLASKLLEREGDAAPGKKLMQYFDETLPTDQKGKFPNEYTSVVQLLRIEPAFLSSEETQYVSEAEKSIRDDRASYVKTYQTNGLKYLEEENPSLAVREIRKGIGLDPFHWYLHYLSGMALYQQENHPAALEELEFSIWCRDNVESHLLMAEIYRREERFAEAKEQVQKSLALDPNSKQAQEIWGRIWDKQK